MIFVSYAREDRDIADAVVHALESALGLEVWSDRRIRTGDAYTHAIGAALERAWVVVVLWSRHAVASEYVIDEATRARRKSKLLPVRIEDVEPPPGFGVLQTLDLLPPPGNGARDLRPLADELIRWIPREIDLPGVLRLDADQSRELALLRTLTRERRVSLVCARAESVAGYMFHVGLNLLGLKCGFEPEPFEATGADMVPALAAVAAADLCVALVFPSLLGGWYIEACHAAARGRMRVLLTGPVTVDEVRRDYRFLAGEPDTAFLPDRPLGLPLDGPGLARTWETLRFLLRALETMPRTLPNAGPAVR